MPKSVMVVCAIVLLCPSMAVAQEGPFLEVSTELAPVSMGTLDTTWRATRLAAGVHEPARFGWTLSAERHDRRPNIDWIYQAGGFRRAGKWTFVGSFGVGPRPTFLYRRSAEGEVARQLAGGFVVHGAYRHVAFPHASVGLAQPAISWYFRRGDVHVRGFLMRNRTEHRTGTTVLVRGSVDVSSRVRVTAGSAIGNRIFDVAALPHIDGKAWVGFGIARFRLTRNLSVDLGAGAAGEEPAFRQRTVSLGFRQVF